MTETVILRSLAEEFNKRGRPHRESSKIAADLMPTECGKSARTSCIVNADNLMIIKIRHALGVGPLVVGRRDKSLKLRDTSALERKHKMSTCQYDMLCSARRSMRSST